MHGRAVKAASRPTEGAIARAVGITVRLVASEALMSKVAETVVGGFGAALTRAAGQGWPGSDWIRGIAGIDAR